MIAAASPFDSDWRDLIQGRILMPRAFAKIAFTPSVRSIQEQQGSATSYAKFLRPDVSGGDLLTRRETEFITERDGFYQATVSETGWPYVQFRGGPPGFLKILSETQIGYADFRGNQQYVSAGNLDVENRISLILMDYPNRRRLKIWGHATKISIEDDPATIADLHVADYKAVPERAVIISVDAFDWNCPQHIPQRYTVEEFDQLGLAD
jgi:predicted pyridoxine 5'-phosphate oxidase superfamily flavin-nucleotide-binding protein